jgi:hypothetical protein
LSAELGLAREAAVDARVESEAPSPVLVQCLDRVMLAMRFPAPEAGDVTVRYAMQFGP